MKRATKYIVVSCAAVLPQAVPQEIADVGAFLKRVSPPN